MAACVRVEDLYEKTKEIESIKSKSASVSIGPYFKVLCSLFELKIILGSYVKELRKKFTGKTNCDIYDLDAYVETLSPEMYEDELSHWTPMAEISRDIVLDNEKRTRCLERKIAYFKNSGRPIYAAMLSYVLKNHNVILERFDEIEFVLTEYIATINEKKQIYDRP